MKSVADSDNVKVTVAVLPAARLPEPVRVIEIVGRVVSPTPAAAFTGVSRGDVVVPSPVCPRGLAPQHFLMPVVVSAQVWTGPALMALIAEIGVPPELCPVATTSTGLVDWAVKPLPSCPSKFHPQHFAPDVVRTAHVWLLVIEMISTEPNKLPPEV